MSWQEWSLPWIASPRRQPTSSRGRVGIASLSILPLERRETLRRQLVHPASGPVRRGHPRPHPLAGGLQIAGERGDVDAEDAAVAHADFAVDDRGVEVFGLG